MKNSTTPSLSKRYAMAIMRQVEHAPNHGYDSPTLSNLFLILAVLFWINGMMQKEVVIAVLFKVTAVINMVSALWRFIIRGFVELITTDYEKKPELTIDEEQ